MSASVIDVLKQQGSSIYHSYSEYKKGEQLV